MSTLTERVSSNLGSLSSADDLARDLGQHVASQPVSSASSVSVELSEVFSVLLYAACATESPSVEDAAAFIDKVFGALPDSSKSTASDEEEQDQEKQTQEAPQVIEQAPKNHRQLLQFAILDVLWAIDSSFEGDAQPWPAPRDAPKPLQELSPQRYKLRNLLALIRVRLPSMIILKQMIHMVNRTRYRFPCRSYALPCKSLRTPTPKAALLRARSEPGLPCCSFAPRLEEALPH